MFSTPSKWQLLAAPLMAGSGYAAFLCDAPEDTLVLNLGKCVYANKRMIFNDLNWPCNELASFETSLQTSSGQFFTATSQCTGTETLTEITAVCNDEDCNQWLDDKHAEIANGDEADLSSTVAFITSDKYSTGTPTYPLSSLSIELSYSFLVTYDANSALDLSGLELTCGDLDAFAEEAIGELNAPDHAIGVAGYTSANGCAALSDTLTGVRFGCDPTDTDCVSSMTDIVTDLANADATAIADTTSWVTSLTFKGFISHSDGVNVNGASFEANPALFVFNTQGQRQCSEVPAFTNAVATSVSETLDILVPTCSSGDPTEPVQQIILRCATACDQITYQNMFEDAVTFKTVIADALTAAGFGMPISEISFSMDSLAAVVSGPASTAAGTATSTAAGTATNTAAGTATNSAAGTATNSAASTATGTAAGTATGTTAGTATGTAVGTATNTTAGTATGTNPVPTASVTPTSTAAASNETKLAFQNLSINCTQVGTLVALAQSVLNISVNVVNTCPSTSNVTTVTSLELQCVNAACTQFMSSLTAAMQSENTTGGADALAKLTLFQQSLIEAGIVDDAYDVLNSITVDGQSLNFGLMLSASIISSMSMALTACLLSSN